ncbi:glutamate 5-kinase [Desulfomarina sp.]
MESHIDREEGLYFRQTLFDKARRVVVKVGSAILTAEDGMDYDVIQNLAREIAFLHNSGREVILVTSGAVAAGRKKLDFADKNISIKEKQALAAIGQSCLMHLYDEAFDSHDKKIAQILLTHSDLSSRSRYLNVRNTILTLFKLGVIPVVNENDTVSIEELKFSDNDNLGALVANLIEADMFICLTDVDALYDADPQQNSNAKPVYTVSEITPEIEAMAGNSKSALGTGGMQSKINAVKMVAAGGGSSFIGPGKKRDILQHLFSGEMVGTFFLPKKEKMQSRKRWIAYVLKPRGTLFLDKGACAAVSENGKSLLPSGVTGLDGEFEVGDSVVCVDEEGRKIAVGLVNYTSVDLFKIKGLRTDKIEQVLGYKDVDEILHRDNLVVL